MSVQRVQADAVTSQPWRNGGGRTRGLLAWPEGDDWRLRISVADIDADGPFSVFTGVQRWFAVISGAGVSLNFGDGERRVLAGGEPLCFDGAGAPGCRLIDGPTRDLNLMARGGAACMRPVAAGVPCASAAPQRGLFCAVAGTVHGTGGQGQGQNVVLAPFTLLWQVDAEPGSLSFTPERAADGPLGWWLEYSPA